MKLPRRPKPPLSPFISPYQFENWLDRVEPQGDFCWVALTPSGYRLGKAWKPWHGVNESGAGWTGGWVFAAVGWYMEESEVEAVAA